MKRICSYCKSNLGEKCGKCGFERLVNLGKPDNFDASLPDLYECLRCHYRFLQGADGVTDGICPPCLVVQLASINDGELKPLVSRCQVTGDR